MSTHSSPRSRRIGRRGLLIGAGAAALTAGTVVPVAAAPVHGIEDGDSTTGVSAPSHAHPDGSPITSTIASGPISGYTYRSICMYDFRPFDPNAQLTWGGYGTYSAGTASPIRASVDIPTGALIRDIEYYLYNNTGSNFFTDAYLYAPGYGSVSPIGGSATVPSSAGITANRAILPANSAGPYPLGSRLLISINTPNSGLVQANGARIGFSRGAATTGLLDAPIRAYDSRNGDGKITGGTTRTITLPPSIVVPGTTGILANITAVNATGGGYLTIYSAAAVAPNTSTINYTAETAIANATTIGVSAAGQMKVFAYRTTDVIIDITGVIA